MEEEEEEEEWDEVAPVSAGVGYMVASRLEARFIFEWLLSGTVVEWKSVFTGRGARQEAGSQSERGWRGEGLGGQRNGRLSLYVHSSLNRLTQLNMQSTPTLPFAPMGPSPILGHFACHARL